MKPTTDIPTQTAYADYKFAIIRVSRTRIYQRIKRDAGGISNISQHSILK